MKSLAGMILGIVGSIFSLVFALLLGIFSIFIIFGKRALVEYNLSHNLISLASSLIFWFILLSLWFLVFGILGLLFSSMMNRGDRARKGGLYCIIGGILSLNLFLLIGGIIGFLGSNRVQKTVPTPESSAVKEIVNQAQVNPL